MSPRRWLGRVAPAVVTGVVALLIGVVIGIVAAQPNDPADDSVEAGFARAMVDHHAQAVEMADIVRSRADDAPIVALATDIVLTQQNQIGRLEGWLDSWGVRQTTLNDPMRWMGHQGAMPGMATRADVAALSTLPVPTAEARFLTLMISHHQGGIEMAEAILARSERRELRRFARAVIDGQRVEIATMQTMAASLHTSGGS